MSDTIDSLELQIESNATSAIGGIDALSSSLSKLKDAVSGGLKGLNTISNQLTKFGTAMQSISSTSADNLSRIANSLSQLSSLGNIKISSTISKNLASINTAASALNSTSTTGITNMATALSSLSSLGKSNLSSFITQLSKLPQLATTLQSVNMAQFTQQINNLATALTPLASQLNTISTAFSRLPSRLTSTVKATNAIATANNNASRSYINLWARARMAYNSVSVISRVIAGWINSANKYIEDINLFTASMGEYVNEAQNYANQVSEAMGIDPGQFMRYEGVFNTIIEGFGVASDKAYLMSKNLTQLGYDLSSFYNISFEDAMTKLQSGISGELEPLRRLGYDLSVARLQQEALNLGISKSVNEMTQAEKSQLRYYAILTQVTTAQGDMARTLNAPANQLRILQAQLDICARELGNVFIPLLNTVLPYAIAFVKVIRMIAAELARLVGFELPEVDYSGLKESSNAVGNLTDNENEATKTAKKLKNAVSGIDELNIISPDTSDSDDNGYKGNDLGIDLPTYNFFDEAVQSKVDDIMKQIQPFIDWLKNNFNTILTTVTAIGAAILAWEISKGLMSGLEFLSRFKSKNLKFSIGFKAIGVLGFLSDLNTFVKYFEDFQKNGATFSNVTGMLSEFVGMIGWILIGFGKLKLGGALIAVRGLGEIVSGIADIAQNGVNFDNASSVVRGISGIMIGLGMLSGRFDIAGIGLILQGISGVIGQIDEIYNAITTGDWSNVDWTTLVISIGEVIGGILLIVGLFDKLKGAAGVSNAVTATQEVSNATQGINSEVSGRLSPRLSSLAKNLGMGLVIITEVAAAAALIVGAIALLGVELNAVGMAWQPIIENGATIATAIGIGTGILVAIGIVTGLLGSVGGTTLIVNLALGIAVLAEIGVATGLFIAEIWAIGWGLEQVGIAWLPVILNGNTIATAIGIGTAILLAIGVATAALGVATVATAGLLPLAIGLGTALLVELGVAAGAFITEIWAIGKGLEQIGIAWQPVLDNGETISTGIEVGTGLLIAIGVVAAALGVASVASVGLLPLAIDAGTNLLNQLANSFISFCDDLIRVSKQLGEKLAPALSDVNTKLPGLSNNMSDFVDFMSDFAGQVVRYTEVSAISGLSATIGNIIDWFTQDPIEKLANDVDKIYNQAKYLNEKLYLAVPELRVAADLLSSYQKFIDEINRVTDFNYNGNMKYDMFVNMYEVGQSIIIGFSDGIKSKSEEFKNAATTIINSFKNEVNDYSDKCKSVIKTWGENIKNWFTTAYGSAVNANTFGKFARDIVNGFNDDITSNYNKCKSVMVSWGSNLKNWFSNSINTNAFRTLAQNIVTAFKNEINISSQSVKNVMSNFANNVKNWFNAPFGFSLSTSFRTIGQYVVQGFINGVNDMWGSAMKRIKEFGTSIIATGKKAMDEHSPSKAFKQIGMFAVEGFNIGIQSMFKSSDTVMQDWTKNIKAFSPNVAMQVDTSSIKAVPQYNVSAPSVDYRTDDEDFAKSMEKFYKEYIENTILNIADDVKRQADKSEKISVKIGSKEIASAVAIQQKANGYVFTR